MVEGMIMGELLEGWVGWTWPGGVSGGEVVGVGRGGFMCVVESVAGGGAGVGKSLGRRGGRGWGERGPSV